MEILGFVVEKSRFYGAFSCPYRAPTGPPVGPCRGLAVLADQRRCSPPSLALRSAVVECLAGWLCFGWLGFGWLLLRIWLGFRLDFGLISVGFGFGFHLLGF